MDTDGNGCVELDEYKSVLREQPGLFNWFSILNNNSNVNPYDLENTEGDKIKPRSSMNSQRPTEEAKTDLEESIR